MSDNDKPITQGQVTKAAGCTAGALLIFGVIGAVLIFILYIMACANMPTGCH